MAAVAVVVVAAAVGAAGAVVATEAATAVEAVEAVEAVVVAVAVPAWLMRPELPPHDSGGRGDAPRSTPRTQSALRMSHTAPSEGAYVLCRRHAARVLLLGYPYTLFLFDPTCTVTWLGRCESAGGSGKDDRCREPHGWGAWASTQPPGPTDTPAPVPRHPCSAAESSTEDDDKLEYASR